VKKRTTEVLLTLSSFSTPQAATRACNGINARNMQNFQVSYAYKRHELNPYSNDPSVNSNLLILPWAAAIPPKALENAPCMETSQVSQEKNQIVKPNAPIVAPKETPEESRCKVDIKDLANVPDNLQAKEEAFIKDKDTKKHGKPPVSKNKRNKTPASSKNVSKTGQGETVPSGVSDKSLKDETAQGSLSGQPKNVPKPAALKITSSMIRIKPKATLSTPTTHDENSNSHSTSAYATPEEGSFHDAIELQKKDVKLAANVKKTHEKSKQSKEKSTDKKHNVGTTPMTYTKVVKQVENVEKDESKQPTTQALSLKQPTATNNGSAKSTFKKGKGQASKSTHKKKAFKHKYDTSQNVIPSPTQKVEKAGDDSVQVVPTQSPPKVDDTQELITNKTTLPSVIAPTPKVIQEPILGRYRTTKPRTHFTNKGKSAKSNQSKVSSVPKKSENKRTQDMASKPTLAVDSEATKEVVSKNSTPKPPISTLTTVTMDHQSEPQSHTEEDLDPNTSYTALQNMLAHTIQNLQHAVGLADTTKAEPKTKNTKSDIASDKKNTASPNPKMANKKKSKKSKSAIKASTSSAMTGDNPSNPTTPSKARSMSMHSNEQEISK
jgi:hypothetical protein